MNDLVIHVGYPKTATSTLQMHLFPHHPEIRYLGKNLPGHGYSDSVVQEDIVRLAMEDETRYEGTSRLKERVDRLRSEASRKVVLLSTEVLTHVAAVDRGVVARRLHDAFFPCKILIVLREQADLLRSFYAMHGRFGMYLFLTGEHEDDLLHFPMAPDEWLDCLFRLPERNLLATIHYCEVARFYARLFGKSNVGVFLFEEYVRQPQRFMARLCDFIGINLHTAWPLVQGKHENRRYSNLERLYKGLGKILPLQRLDWTRSGVPSWLLKHADLLGREQIRFSSAATGRIAALYGEGNRRLMAEFGLPLKHYGYAVGPAPADLEGAWHDGTHARKNPASVGS
jgi:hypothetical protein